MYFTSRLCTNFRGKRGTSLSLKFVQSRDYVYCFTRCLEKNDFCYNVHRMELNEAIDKIKAACEPYLKACMTKVTPFVEWVEQLSTPPAIGVVLRDHLVQIAQLEKRGGQIDILTLSTILPHELNAITAGTWKQATLPMIIGAVPTSQTLIRPLELHGVKERDIDSVLPFQSEPLFPYPIEEAILKRILISRKGEVNKLSVLAIRKEDISHRLSEYHTMGIEPELLTSESVGLAAFFNALHTSHAPYVGIYVGDKAIRLLLISKRCLIASHAIEFSGDVSLESGTIVQQVMQTVLSFSKSLRGSEIEAIAFTGPKGTDSRVNASLAKELNKKILKGHPQVFEGHHAKEIHDYALPIGLALCGLETNTKQFNYREGELAFPAPWKRALFPLSLFFIGALILALIIFAISSYSLNSELDKLRSEYSELLTVFDRTHAEYEKTLSQKGVIDEQTDSADQLTVDQLSNRTAALRSEIHSTPMIFPLTPRIPLVSDLLAWLANHPNVIKDTPEGDVALIQIESLNYQMIKRPDKNKPKERYQVKVELVFTSPEPMLAREFHNALLQANPLVDPRSEVKWSFSEGKYRTSFFLKDNTAYY